MSSSNYPIRLLHSDCNYGCKKLYNIGHSSFMKIIQKHDFGKNVIFLFFRGQAYKLFRLVTYSFAAK